MQDNGDLEQQVIELLSTLKSNSSSSVAWRRAMDRLLRVLPAIPGIFKSSHSHYPEVWNDVLLRVSREIDSFIVPKKDVLSSLAYWINLKLRLKYAIRDLQRGDRATKTRSPKSLFQYQARQPPLSLDRPITSDSEQTFADQLPTPTLATLEDYLSRVQHEAQQEILAADLQQYIETDPEIMLRDCHPRKYPQANAQFLALRLLLKEPPDTLAQIARELTINYHTLNWHWQNKALPLLREIALSWGYKPPDLS